MMSLLAAAEKWDSSAMPFSCVSKKLKIKIRENIQNVRCTLNFIIVDGKQKFRLETKDTNHAWIQFFSFCERRKSFIHSPLLYY
jgi:hypothetical protein